MANSNLVLTFPFAAALAWTTVTLGGASRFLGAISGSRRLVWAVVTALAWGQTAAPHLSLGAVIGTGALAAFVVVRTIGQIARKERSRRDRLAHLRSSARPCDAHREGGQVGALRAA